VCFLPSVRRRITLSIVVTVVAIGTVARADEEPVSLDYAAGAGCPSKDDFVARVLARTARPQFVPGRPGVRGFVVRARAEDGGATGSVAAGFGDQIGNARELRSDDCDEIVSGLALIVALAVDPRASTAPAPQRPPPAAPTLPAPPPPDPPAPVARPVEPVSAARIEPRSTEDAWLTQARVQGIALFGATTVPIGGAGLSLEWQAHRARAIAPAVRLSIGAGASATAHPAGGGAARFSLLSARVDLSPIVFALSKSIALRPSVGLEAGQFAASGAPDGAIVYARPSVNRPWLAIHETLRFQIDIGRGWLFDLEAGAAEPLQNDTFEFHTPEITVLQVPRLAPTLALGVSVRIL
jgi:hypothetical protein